MIISFIVAVDEKNGMGKNNQLPWHLPADFKMFKETTKDHCILMGRKTFESLGKPLPHRTNIVLTREDFSADGIVVRKSIQEGINYAREQEEKELFIIGGAQIFAQSFEYADKLYITRVNGIFEADTFFPEYDQSKWDMVAEAFHPSDEKNKYDFTFYQYLRKNS